MTLPVLERPAHSLLGASSAERWMNCPGSVALLQKLTLPESDEADYRMEGTAAHAVAAHCLLQHLDAWEVIGQVFEKIEVSEDMASAVQVYLDHVRGMGGENAVKYVECKLSAPDHKDFFGTVDYGQYTPETAVLEIVDYKHGKGITVDVEWNPQVMYYGYMLLLNHPEARTVRMTICQPRGFHPDGPIRTWEISAEALTDWVNTELVPAMNRTELDHDLDAGPWCRFCPAKLVCPLLSSLFGAACTANAQTIVNLSDESLGRSYQYVQAVKFYLKAMEDEAFRRLNTGAEIDGVKLVNKKANRVFKPEALAVFKSRFGDEAFTAPELKSPAEMAKIDATAKELVHEYAYTPNTGVTVALAADKRPGVKVQTSAAAFGDAVAALDKQDTPSE